MVRYPLGSGHVCTASSRYSGGVIVTIPNLGGNNGRRLPPNTPIVSLGALGILCATLVVVIVTGHAEDSDTLMTVILANIPGLIAALYSERSSRDIRNGTVTNKVKDALDQTGVTEVARVAKETTPATLEALTNSTKALTALVARDVMNDNARLHPLEKDKNNDG